MNSIVITLKQKQNEAGKSGQWNLETLCKMAALEIETKAARIATLEAENTRLTADAKLNDMAWNDNQAALKAQAAEIARLTEKVRYAYVQIEALEAK